MKLSNIVLLPFFAIFLLLSSCGVLNLESSTESYDIEKEVVPSYKSDQTIKVMNYYDKPVIVFLVPERIKADLKQYSETSMKYLELGLKHQNVSVGVTGNKSVKLRVHNVKYNRAFWTIRADVNITAELGNGKTFGVFHHNASPASGFLAVDGALIRATEKILKHPEFIKYMNK